MTGWIDIFVRLAIVVGIVAAIVGLIVICLHDGSGFDD
jgi:hypothetical protein